MLKEVTPKIQEKGGAHGGLRLIVLCFELGFIWLVYYIYGIAAAHEMPLWLTTSLVIVVDRITTFITSQANNRKQRLAERRNRG